MRPSIFVAACAAFFAGSACLTPGVGAENNTDADATGMQIRKVIQEQEAAWNAGDLEGFMKGYARSDNTTFVSGDEVTRGWQTVLERYKARYSSRDKMGTLTFSDLEITPLGPDAAVVLGRWQLKRAQDNPRGRFTLIFRQLPEGWRIVQDHTSAAAP